MVAPDDPGAAAWNAIRGAWEFGALHAMARLGLAVRLADRPLTAAELAARCGAQEDRLVRLLRALTALGYVTCDDGGYALTRQGAALHPDAPGSMHWAVMFVGAPWSWRVTVELDEAVRTGRAPLNERHGSLYDHLAQNPRDAEVFDTYMASRARQAAASLAEHGDFGGVRTVADIGGGIGHMLAAVLKAHPGLRGVLLDRPDVAGRARAFLGEQGVSDRCEVVAGDYFAAVPEGADLYILASILHNHGDEGAVKILRTVRDAMHSGSRLLVIDAVLPSDHSPHFGFLLDMRMMTIFDEGQERDESEITAVAERAGMRITKIDAMPPTALSMLTLRAR
jgi:hypothetical protein